MCFGPAGFALALARTIRLGTQTVVHHRPPHRILAAFTCFLKRKPDGRRCIQKAQGQKQCDAKLDTIDPASGAGPLTPPAGKLLGDGNDGSFVAEAGNVPFRLVADYLASGDARSKTALGKMNDWIKTKTGGDATKIVDGYKLDGTPIGTKGTMSFIAPFGAAAIIDAGNQAWLDALWKLMTAADTVSNDPDTTNVLGMLVASGNWWGP